MNQLRVNSTTVHHNPVSAGLALEPKPPTDAQTALAFHGGPPSSYEPWRDQVAESRLESMGANGSARLPTRAFQGTTRRQAGKCPLPTSLFEEAKRSVHPDGRVQAGVA